MIDKSKEKALEIAYYVIASIFAAVALVYLVLERMGTEIPLWASITVAVTEIALLVVDTFIKVRIEINQ